MHPFSLRLFMALGLLCMFDVVRADEWKTLFDGKDLSAWKSTDGPMSSWTIQDGVLACSGIDGGWLSTLDEYVNFEIELQFRLPAGGNSGVFLRAPHDANPAFTGMEIQLLDDESSEYTNLKPFQYCGSLYGIAAPKSRVSKKKGEWQTMWIRCEGRNVKVKLNGTLIVDADLDKHQDALATHPGINRKKGYIGLQNHRTRADFKEIRLRVLP